MFLILFNLQKTRPCSHRDMSQLEEEILVSLSKVFLTFATPVFCCKISRILMRLKRDSILSDFKLSICGPNVKILTNQHLILVATDGFQMGLLRFMS